MSIEEQAEAIAERFNRDHEVGTAVTYRPIAGSDHGIKTTKTRYKAYVANCGLPVVFVEGQAGFVALSHVDVIKEEAPGANA